MTHLLEIRDLRVTMGPQPILQGVSLDVPAGGIVTVLGSNGVGKTTLMRAISGVYKVGGGEIRLDGTPITNLATHDIVRLGVCQAPEGRQIFSSMTVLENLRLGAGPRGGREYEQDLERMLALFPRLRERLSQKAGSLSGGEQQMLCVGRALMGRPRLLLMDEPSLGLAPKLVRQIFDLVAMIRETGTAILLVEQNAKAALRVADQAYVMESGRIVLQGPAAELAEDPRIRAAYLGGHVH
ncbi:ABC transporter ATP-binding protein [Azospirillum rugosum]|uniref:Branched-chain amino acid transport system ATP-binding protein n=1 Tax=Azospirillum rugosum TaxID=416170 RepID=A0ABS4SEP1_9PROT|nr:ABC transporter ATP-binding protein [Azospirillum rugosum]MBP2290967.1 branched-chain amino acid transport system ATP-binding protein [Azospirillum rugosum]MDQ0524969.1 branched-chain amino acid transport system ATP-binding protein [Azospirillum rugosum]